MKHLEKLAGAWIEIKERGDENHTVLMRAEANVPPTRGGRRRLEIDAKGQALSMAQGATDRMEATAKGDWDIQDDRLKLKLDGWEAEYSIETMTENELTLKRR